MRRIIASSLRFRFIVVVGAMALLVFGFGQVQGMPVDVFPEFAPPRVEVQTITLGLSAAEVESLVTIPLEQSLAGVRRARPCFAPSLYAQLSQIELIFKSGALTCCDARQLVQERIRSASPAQLPTVGESAVHHAAALVDEPGHEDRPVLGHGRSVLDLSMHRRTGRSGRALLGVPGVANVMICGERLEHAHTSRPIPERMLAEHGVSIGTVMQATSEALDEGILQFSDGELHSAPVAFGRDRRTSA